MNCSFFLGGFLTFLFIWLLIYEVRGLENDQGDFKVKAWLFSFFFLLTIITTIIIIIYSFIPMD